jgi:hypothetical protein
LKAELEALKEAGEQVKENFAGEEFKEKAKELKEKPEPDARAAYRKAFGQPPFSEDEWTQWKEWAEKSKVKFEASDYGK